MWFYYIFLDPENMGIYIWIALLGASVANFMMILYVIFGGHFEFSGGHLRFLTTIMKIKRSLKQLYWIPWPWKHRYGYQNGAFRSFTYLVVMIFRDFWQPSWILKGICCSIKVILLNGFLDPENMGIDVRIALLGASLCKFLWFYVIFGGHFDFFGD